MGNVAYMSLYDTAGELIQGGSYVTDRKGCIEVHKINYRITREVDSQTGKTHSTRRHEPFSILKPLDCATPALFDCCAKGKLIKEARIDLFKTNDEGYEENYLTYLLVNARITCISPVVNCDSGHQDMEAVSFAFEEIAVAYNNGNIVAMDSWCAR